MNNRIQQLAEQSGIVIPKDSEYNGHIYRNTIEKFARLIVLECANHCDLLLDHKISSEWSRGTHDCSRAIKKHFGVER